MASSSPAITPLFPNDGPIADGDFGRDADGNWYTWHPDQGGWVYGVELVCNTPKPEPEPEPS